MKRLAEERGQVLILVAFSVATLLLVLSVAIDAGQLYYAQRRLQTVADAAALAAALETSQCGLTSNCTDMQQAAKSAAAENGFSNPSFYAQCAAVVQGTGGSLTINNGPCALGAADPNYLNAKFAEAVVSQRQPTFFGSLIHINSVGISARSEAALGPPKNCLFVLNPSAPQAMKVGGNATLVAHCGVAVNSSSPSSIQMDGGASVTAPAISTHGGYVAGGNAYVSPTPTTYAPVVPDPLANLPIPTSPSGSQNQPATYSGSATPVRISGGSTNVVFNPGTYSGGIHIGSHASVIFNPGTYIINGPMHVDAAGAISGNGVTLYFSSGALSLDANSHVNLVAPTTGTYAGILVYQSSTDTTTVRLNGDSTTVWQGTIYLPSAELRLDGGSNLAVYTILDVNTLVLDGSNNFSVGNDYSSLPGGPPIHGLTAYLMQ